MKATYLIFLIAPAAWAGADSTPAELAAQTAQTEIAQHPGFAPAYARLAMAYARRAREADNASFLDQAQDALRKSFAIAPGNYDARKAQAFVLLGRHEWSRALDIAIDLNKQTPDDITNYGYIADAKIALGDFDGAVEATQWMLNLRTGNAAGLARASRLRELHGDYKGSLEVLQMALDATSFGEREERAWLLTQMARVHLEGGEAKAAEDSTAEALAAFPGYYLAAAVRGEIATHSAGAH